MKQFTLLALCAIAPAVLISGGAGALGAALALTLFLLTKDSF